MGMITRVRGRLHSITKIDPQVKDEKIAETVCLLSVLFLLPYCGRGHAPLLLGLGSMWLAMYSCLVLPVLISANYKYPVRWLRRFVEHIPDIGLKINNIFFNYLEPIICPIQRVINAYMDMSSVFIIVNQLLFFAMCDIALCNYEETNKTAFLVGLNSLLFYYVITYFVERIINIIEKINSNTDSERTAGHRTFNSLFLCILKIILEWAKAVIAIICLREQGLKAHPHIIYTTITCLYYVATEPTYATLFPNLIKLANCQIADEMEVDAYTPVLLNCFVITMSIALLPIVFIHHIYFAVVCSFHSYLTYANMMKTYWTHLKREKSIMRQFQVATTKDIEKWNDICAICLGNMRFARITVCGHLFHRKCLISCLKLSNLCPLCKTVILENKYTNKK